MARGIIAKDGTVTITYNPYNGDKLYTDRGAAHLLPCEHCGDIVSVSLRTVSVVCADCATADLEQYAGIMEKY